MAKIRSFRSVRLVVAAGGLAAAITFTPAGARADDTGTPEGAGMGAASMLATLLYGPAKLVYATTGGIVGGLAYGLTGGNADVAVPILESSLYGDYYVTPEQLRGEKSIEFVGRGSDDVAPDVSSDGIPPAEAPPTDVSSSDAGGF
jgi:hypothetical protein